MQASTDSSGIAPPSEWTAEVLEDWLSEHATAINEGREPSSSVDLFQQGFDRYASNCLFEILLTLHQSERHVSAQSNSRCPQVI